MQGTIRVLVASAAYDEAARWERELRQSGLGAECEWVESRDAFLGALKSGDWHIVLGSALPGMGPQDILKSVQERNLQIPFIAVSGFSRAADVVALLRDGAQDVVDPHELDRLVPSVNRVLRQREALTRALEDARASEERYRRLVEISPDGILVHTDDIVQFANAALAEMLGAQSPEELIGRSSLEFVPEKDRAMVLARRVLATEGGAPLKYRETQYRRFDGSLMDVERAVSTISWQGRPSFLIVARDIGERKRAAASLAESEAMLRRITDGVPAMIGYCGRDGILQFANRRYVEWFGARHEDIICKPIAGILGPKAYARTEPYRQKALAGEEVTFEGARPLGEASRPYRATFIPHRDAAGEVQGYFVMRLDIGEQRRMEEALRASEERFRAFFNNSPASMHLIDAEGRFVLTNREFRRRYRLAEDEVVGKTVADVQTPEVAAKYTEMNETVLRENRTVTGVVEHIYPDGSPHANLVIKFPVRDVNGRPVAVGSVNSDISDIQRMQRALRDSEEKFRGLVEGALQGILIHVSGAPKYVNTEYARIFGRTADEFMNMASVYDIVHPDDRDIVVKLVKAREEGRINSALYEFRGIHKDGSIKSIYAKGSLIEWEGEPANYVAAIDVTEQKQMEAQLHQSQKMEAVGQLTGGLAHDFNNLLTVVLGNLQLAQTKDANPAPFLETSIRAVRRGAELTQRLLAFSRRQALAPRATDVNALVGGMKTMLERTLGAHIHIVTKLVPGIRPASIDPAQMENALLNIGLNARDAMPDGGTLTIETRDLIVNDSQTPPWPGAEPGNYVVIEISDTGVGMPPEVQRQAFEPFFTTKEAGEGTGLGLSMVYGFAKQSKGQVELDAIQGEGTRIRLFLPRIEEGPIEQVESTAEETVKSGSETVLVVEDDPEVRILATSMLEQLGYAVLEAKNGKEGLDVLSRDEKGEIDLLLTDVVLPGGMNGRMVADEALKIRPGLPILFTSGYAENILFRDGRMEEGISFLPKPYTFQSLSQSVRLALEKGKRQ